MPKMCVVLSALHLSALLENLDHQHIAIGVGPTANYHFTIAWTWISYLLWNTTVLLFFRYRGFAFCHFLHGTCKKSDQRFSDANRKWLISSSVKSMDQASRNKRTISDLRKRQVE